MAIYHLNVKTGSKGSGQSAAAKADYIEREGKYADGKEEVQTAAHGNMPEWAQEDPHLYWQTADRYERANGRLFTQVEFALPVELTAAEQNRLAHDFAEKLTAELSLPYSLAVHKGRYDHSGQALPDGHANPHCHLLISERMNDGIDRPAAQWFRRTDRRNPARGGATKTEILKSRDWLCQTRAIWQDMANAALERHGHEARIDHRTLEAQGITDRLPQTHIGSASKAMRRKGLPTPRTARVEANLRESLTLTDLSREKAALTAKIANLEQEEKQLRRGEPENHPTPDLFALPLARLQMRYDSDKAMLEEARRHQRSLNYLAEELPRQIRVGEDNAAEVGKQLAGLRKGILGSWRRKNEIADAEAKQRHWLQDAARKRSELEAIPGQQRQLGEVLKLLERRFETTKRALGVAGQKERDNALQGQPEAIREAWQSYEQVLRRQTGMNGWDAMQRERRLRDELAAFLANPQQAVERQRQREQGRGRGRGFER